LKGEEPSVENSSNDSNMVVPFDEAIGASIVRIFEEPGGVLEIGCGQESEMMIALKYAGHEVFGYDLNPSSSVGEVSKYNLRNPGLHYFDVQRHMLCTKTLCYLTIPEMVRALKWMFETFTDRAFIYTPDSSQQMTYDPACITFVDAQWLAWVCSQIGGYAFVLNFYHDPNTGYGPAVCWLKEEVDSWRTATKVMLAVKSAVGDPRFSITLE